MAKEPGTEVLLLVEDSAMPGTYTAVDGQQSTAYDGSTEVDDVSDKNQAGYGSSLAVLKRVTVTASGKAVWPDTKGLKELIDAYEALTPINAQLKWNAAGEGRQGPFTISALNINGDYNTACNYSVTLENAEALTVLP